MLVTQLERFTASQLRLYGGTSGAPVGSYVRLFPEGIDEYLGSDQTRREKAGEAVTQVTVSASWRAYCGEGFGALRRARRHRGEEASTVGSWESENRSRRQKALGEGPEASQESSRLA